jgi:deoxyribonuclease-4
MNLGVHISAAGGVERAPERAAALGLETFQFFTRPPQGGRVSPIAKETASAFRAACERHGLERCYVHAPFFINLASKEERIRRSSIEILREELERASILGVAGMMFHPGSASGVGEEKGEELVIAGIRKILRGYRGSARLLVEISAGAGMIVCDRFEEVARVLAGTDHDQLGVCFDTAHAFASGYDLRTPESVRKVMREFDHLVGFDRLALTHCNDSKVGLGERKDRHEHIGKGQLGLDAFRALLAHPKFGKLDFILETEEEGWPEDIETLKQIRREVKSHEA